MSKLIHSRTFTIFLCAAMLACTASCGGDAPSVGDTAAAETTPAETKAEVLASGVPDTLDLDGETITIYNAPNNDGLAWLADISEETGDTVEDAIYRRNLAVQEKLNCSLEFIHGKLSDQPNHLRSTILAGDDVYDFCIGTQWKFLPLTTEGVFANLMDAPYIDIDEPWWATEYINTINFGKNSRYYLAGDIHLSYLRFLGCIFYNKTVMNSFHGNPNLPYELVSDGKWTIDKFTELSKGVYSDLNGNGQSDEADRFGYAVMQSISGEHMYYNMGAQTIVMDEKGTPTLEPVTERSVKIAEKMYQLYHESPESMFLKPVLSDIETKMTQKLAADELMFAPGILYLSDFLRDMKSDYGIIPYPKYDEADEYRTLVHDSFSVTFVPITSDRDKAAAVIEEMGFQGYMETSPAYFNVALKGKYMRDGEGDAIEIIDMIRANAYTDIGYAYNYAIDNAGLLIRNLMGSKQSNLTTAWAAVETSAKTKLTALIEAYNAIEK